MSKEGPMGDQRTDRILQLLDDLSAAHTAAALYLDEIRVNLAGEGSAVARSSERPTIDPAAMAVRWRGRTCPLGVTVLFRLIERLCRRPNFYVTREQLIADVWEGNVRA